MLAWESLVILLSLALVLASAATLAWGVFASSAPFIWASLAAGIGAVALVVGSVVRHRRHLVPEGFPDAGPATAGSPAVGAASAGIDPAPSSTPPPRSAPAPPSAGPASPRGAAPPDAYPWPWATPPLDTAGGAPSPTPPAPDAPAAREPAHVPPEVPAWAAQEPGVEQVPVRDALRVAQLADEILVVDGHPRYHVAGCPTLRGAETIPLAVSVARRGGFTPCAVCGPDAALLARSRARAEHKAQQRAAEQPNDEGKQV